MKSIEIFELIRSVVVKVVPKLSSYDLKKTDSLEALGANSIERMEITMLIMEELEVDIPRVELLEPRNIEELISLLELKLSEMKY